MTGRLLTLVAAIAAGVLVWTYARPGRAEPQGTQAVCQITTLRANDAAGGDFFGYSGAIAGDYAIVGALLGGGSTEPNAGSAYVFQRQGLSWVFQEELLGTNTTDNDNFGSSLAASGDLLVVGTPAGQKPTTFNNIGVVYVYWLDPNSGTWVEQTPPLTGGLVDEKSGAEFGASVAISGDRAMVGAPNMEAFGVTSGKVYFFKRQGSTLTKVGSPIASDFAIKTGDRFGAAVALSGDWAIAGAPKADDECPLSASCDSGIATMLRYTGTRWVEHGDDALTASDAAGGYLFGTSVAIDGDVAVVGAVDATGGRGGTTSNAGAAYVFRRNDSGTPSDLTDDVWVEEKKLMAFLPDIFDPGNGGPTDQFGQAVTIKGDTIIVGDNAHDRNLGAAYVFRRIAGEWTLVDILTPTDGQFNPSFAGWSVATDGNRVLLGAVGTNAMAGSAYVFSIADCNANGVSDDCDIHVNYGGPCAGEIFDPVTNPNGTCYKDENGNGVPDTCECQSDDDCTDALDCTDDTCSAQGECVHTAVAGKCVINDTCIDDGTENPGNECQICDTGADPYNWSNVVDDTSCGDGRKECSEEVCRSGSCTNVNFDSTTLCGDQTATDCHDPDTCDGNGSCSDNTKPVTALCRDAIGDCDIAEFCDGISKACPVDVFVAADTACDADGNACTDADKCDGNGTCIPGGNPCADRPCQEDGNDGYECLCDEDTQCDDGVYCNGAEFCSVVGRVCEDGLAPCPPALVCDEDASIIAGEPVCVECVVDADCDDGLACTGVETCAADNTCVTPPPPCPQKCDEAASTPGQPACVDCLTDEDCQDNLFCTGVETCAAGNTCEATGDPCQGTNTPFCDETRDACAECVADADCDDGLFCTGVERCNSGTCAPSSGNPCVSQGLTCDDVVDACKCADASECDDGDLCTADTCAESGQPGVTVCVFTSIAGCCSTSAQCDDGLFCNGAETCSAPGGTCQAGTGSPCSAGQVCIEADDSCKDCAADSDCPDNGKFCDGKEICKDGACISEGDPCTGDAGKCDETGDICVECFDDDTCNDGEYCTGTEKCENGKCVTSGNPCGGEAVDNMCDEHTNACVECLEGTDCDDNDACTADTCPDGVCRNTEISGCQDADHDKVKDDADKCPGTARNDQVDADGCSCRQLDQDDDQVNDCTDVCPNTPADERDTVSRIGCSCSQPADENDDLDDDDDGVDNCVDECRDTPAGGAVNAVGCADSQLDDDRDGVSNDVDQCPGTPANEAANLDGCSPTQLEPGQPVPGDEDDDGVADAADACPDTPAGELVDADGCSDSQLDDDGDGVFNNVDQCPATPPSEVVVGADGCVPEDNTGGTTPTTGTTSTSRTRSPCAILDLTIFAFIFVGLGAMRRSLRRRQSDSNRGL